jgi:hypothetical protein
MCSINHDLKAIFIHTPKCGGLFIEKVLEKFYGFETLYFTHENHTDFVNNFAKKTENHHELNNGFLHITEKGVLTYYMTSDIHNSKTNMTIDKWKSYKKFAVLRNPYDRFISALKYIHSQNSNDINFDIFVKDKINNYPFNNHDDITAYDFFHIFIPQYKHLIDDNNILNIDYFINFENLNADFCNVLLELGVDKIKHRNILLNNTKFNSSSNSNNYCMYYNEELLHFVNNVFNDDFIHFKYEKNDTINELNNDGLKYYIDSDIFCKNNIQLLIELDNKNKIISFEESQHIKTDNNNNDNNDNNDNNNNNNNIVLENGVNLNLNDIKKEYVENNTVNVSGDTHYKNILKLFEKLANRNKTL